MKARTMLYLDPRQMQALKARARSEGISLAALMRRLVTRELDEHRPASPVPADAYARMVALGSSGRSDVSERHDAYLAEAIQQEHAR